MILFLFLVVITALVLEKISLGLPVQNVHYHIGTSAASVEQGEEFYIVTTIENRTKHNISYLRLNESIPSSLCLLDGQTLDFNGKKEQKEHISTLFVRRQERVKRKVRAVSYTRGMHSFRKSEVYFGDFLGLKELSYEEEPTSKILVYPRRIQSDRLEQIVSDICGEISVQSFLYEDPVLVRGYREYTGQEPLRAVSFLQSAKHMQLMVKEFDHTRTPMVNIVLDMEFYGDFDHYFDQREAQFSVARMICERFEGYGMGYRIITNMCYPDMEVRGVNVIESEGNGGFARILDLLGVASGVAICPTGELLSYAKEHYGGEGTFLYIAQRNCGELQRELSRCFADGEGMPRVFYGEEYAECYKKAGWEAKEEDAAP